MTDSKQAPGELELVRAFVNTRDLEEGVENLDSPSALTGWLEAHPELGAGRISAGQRDFERALAVREALRALMLVNAGEPADATAAATTLDEAARRAGVALRFTPSGESRLAPAARGVDGALGRLLAVVAASRADRTWPRLKACRDEGCHWAFYDATKNRSGVWCSMEVCGNRNKARSYRDRHSGTGA